LIIKEKLYDGNWQLKKIRVAP